MKDEADQRQAAWRSFAVPLLAATISALTVWGAILLSLQSQDQSDRMLVQVTEGVTVENIPTADIATVPPLTMIPTWEVTVTPTEASPTLDILATVSVSPVTPSPTSAPLPCAGGAPLHWKLYIVQWGDTLFSLARRHGTTMDQVIFYNCLQSEYVRADQRLYLPPLPTPIPYFTPAPTLTPTPLDPTTGPSPPTTAPTWTSTPSPLPTFTATATFIPTATVTVGPTATETVTPSATPVLTATATSVPTITPISPTVTLEPTATPTPEPVNPTPEPTVSPTPEPSDTPAPSSTPEETPASSPAP